MTDTNLETVVNGKALQTGWQKRSWCRIIAPNPAPSMPAAPPAPAQYGIPTTYGSYETK